MKDLQGLQLIVKHIFNSAYSPPKKDNLKNLFMHLTNYAINKNSEKF